MIRQNTKNMVNELKEASSKTHNTRLSIRFASDLYHPTPCIKTGNLNSEVYALFGRNPMLKRIPGTDKNQIVGMINREKFMGQIAGIFHWEIFHKKRCVTVMDHAPILVESATAIQAVADRLLVDAGSTILLESFIVVRELEFLGGGYPNGKSGGCHEVLADMKLA
ncbi:MAG: hypothetical protein WCL27_16295 [Betaproteobacteria bacterium]